MDGPSYNGPGGVSNKSTLSRAEQFDNEKKRIIESCFSKREEDGSISESYITHIRIEEDGAYPATPSPPNGNPDSKKLRTIIVAVRKTGRVRVHKARENANGTFSIGKTWVLDDLTAVQSFTGVTPPGPNGEQHKLWAGSTGFIVTLGKSYYWKANSQKEKQFFIASLVKIYHKYTGGKLPELICFDQRERDQLMGVAKIPPSQISSTSGSSGSALSPQTSRKFQRDLGITEESDGEYGKRAPVLSGMSPVKKGQIRTKRGSQSSGSADLNMLPSSSSRNKYSVARLSSNQSQKSFGQIDDGNYFSQRPNTNQFLDKEGSFVGTRSRRDSENNMQIPAPLSLPSDARKFLSQEGDSREPYPGPLKSAISASLNNPLLRLEVNLPGLNVERIQLDEMNNVPGETVLVPSSSLNTEKVRPDETSIGLGPILKAKADVGGIFSGAANAFNSLKPMVEGATERFRDLKSKPLEDSDVAMVNISGQGFLRPSSNSSSLLTSSTLPELKISLDNGEDTISQEKFLLSNRVNEESTSLISVDGLPEKSKARTIKKAKSPNEIMNKKLATLGVDPLIISGRSNDLFNIWEQFGWVGEGIRTKNIDEMKDEVERELCRTQAGGWLNRLEEEDERIEAIKMVFDKVIEECDEFDGLLTLYLVELGTLNEDVAYIEAQSQGLQVQTANQKLLQAELQSLLQTISISPEQIESLRESSLESTRGLNDIETSLVILFKAMLTIDPSLGVSSPRRSEDGSLSSGKPGVYGNSEIGSMRVLQEKKDVYKSEITIFLRRLKQFLQIKFAAAFEQTRLAFEREKSNNLSRVSGRVKLDFGKHDLARNILWKYSPLMLFTREVDRLEWENLMNIYGQVLMSLYQEEFREAFMASRRAARKLTGDEVEALFTSQVEKQSEGLATTARKLTVMRSQNLAKSLLSQGGDNNGKSSLDKGQGLEPYEVIEELISRVTSVMSMEQNFFVEFFHVTSLGLHDFPETVAASSPEDRRGVDIKRPRVMDPNRDLAMLVVQSMEEIFSFFSREFQGLVDWSLQLDPLQVVGLIAALERKIPEYEETNQEYLNRTLQKLHTQLIGLFIKFLDDQIRVIEETKVKIKKRKGVIGFMKTFPLFANALEKKLLGAEDLEIRSTVNNAYSRVSKAMFEALKVIARESPSVQIAGTDQAEKEALNYEIMLMQNMHYYLEEVDPRSNPILEEWKKNASDEMNEHMALYLNAAIRRPLGKLLDFIESTENMMISRQPGDSVLKISSMPSHSKSTFKKVLSNYDAKEIRRGIETLRKRVEKHFGDEHDPGIASRNDLVRIVIQNCEKFYENVEDRILTIIRDVYDGEIVLEWTRTDISTAFRK